MTYCAIGIARVREREHDAQVASNETLQGALDLGKATGGQRWWVSFEHHRLAARQHVEPMSTLKRLGKHLVRQVCASCRAEDFLDPFAAGGQDLGGIPQDNRPGCQQFGRQRDQTFGEMRPFVA